MVARNNRFVSGDWGLPNCQNFNLFPITFSDLSREILIVPFFHFQILNLKKNGSKPLTTMGELEVLNVLDEDMQGRVCTILDEDA